MRPQSASHSSIECVVSTIERIERIEDDGIGIAEAVQGRIFERFVQADEQVARRYGGAGLGLAIVKRIADMHHGEIRLAKSTLDTIESGQAAKGNVLATARLAGIMAAKKTADLIPLCHPLAITHAEVGFEIPESRDRVVITATARISAKTGVEMEALTAVSVTALTVYDMAKAVDRAMEIGGIRVKLKDGGKSGRYEAT